MKLVYVLFIIFIASGVLLSGCSFMRPDKVLKMEEIAVKDTVHLVEDELEELMMD